MVRERWRLESRADPAAGVPEDIRRDIVHGTPDEQSAGWESYGHWERTTHPTHPDALREYMRDLAGHNQMIDQRQRRTHGIFANVIHFLRRK